mmetsp:Transcript_33197/g.83777  ORF Transcript_33197/g.83777 Transcript_33197/m.83777 type:complete len:320 (-) Transcript_33197:755-1714(-)
METDEKRKQTEADGQGDGGLQPQHQRTQRWNCSQTPSDGALESLPLEVTHDKHFLALGSVPRKQLEAPLMRPTDPQCEVRCPPLCLGEAARDDGGDAARLCEPLEYRNEAVNVRRVVHHQPPALLGSLGLGRWLLGLCAAALSALLGGFGIGGAAGRYGIDGGVALLLEAIQKVCDIDALVLPLVLLLVIPTQGALATSHGSLRPNVWLQAKQALSIDALQGILESDLLEHTVLSELRGVSAQEGIVELCPRPRLGLQPKHRLQLVVPLLYSSLAHLAPLLRVRIALQPILWPLLQLLCESPQDLEPPLSLLGPSPRCL